MKPKPIRTTRWAVVDYLDVFLPDNDDGFVFKTKKEATKNLKIWKDLEFKPRLVKVTIKSEE